MLVTPGSERVNKLERDIYMHTRRLKWIQLDSEVQVREGNSVYRKAFSSLN